MGSDRDQSIDEDELCRAYAELHTPDLGWQTVRSWDGVYRQMYVGPALEIEAGDRHLPGWRV